MDALERSRGRPRQPWGLCVMGRSSRFAIMPAGDATDRQELGSSRGRALGGPPSRRVSVWEAKIHSKFVTDKAGGAPWASNLGCAIFLTWPRLPPPYSPPAAAASWCRRQRAWRAANLALARRERDRLAKRRQRARNRQQSASSAPSVIPAALLRAMLAL